MTFIKYILFLFFLPFNSVKADTLFRKSCTIEVSEQENSINHKFHQRLCHLQSIIDKADYKKSVQLIKEIDQLDFSDINSSLIVEYWMIKGEYYRLTYNYSDSREFFAKAISHFEKTNQYDKLGNAMISMAELYRTSSQNQLAEEQLERVFYLDSTRRPFSPKVKSRLWHRYASLAQHYRKREVAIERSRRSLSFSIPNDFFEDQATSYAEIGVTYFFRSEYKRAIEFYMKARDLYHQLGLAHYEVELRLRIAQLYCKLDSMENCLQSITDYTEFAEKHGLLNLVNEGDILKAQALFEKGEYKEAYILYEKVMDKKILHERTIYDKEVALLNNQYQSELAFKQLQKVQTQEKLKQTKFIILLAVLIILTLTTWLHYFKQRLNAKNLEISRKQTEMNLRRSQLKNLELETSLENHQREITAMTLSIIRKQEQVAKLQGLSELEQKEEKSTDLREKIRENEIADLDWNKFNSHFSKIHPNFYQTLNAVTPGITQNELRLAALLKNNLNNREISSIIGVNVRTVDQNKYRLKKKLHLNKDENLLDYLQKI